MEKRKGWLANIWRALFWFLAVMIILGILNLVFNLLGIVTYGNLGAATGFENSSFISNIIAILIVWGIYKLLRWAGWKKVTEDKKKKKA